MIPISGYDYKNAGSCKIVNTCHLHDCSSLMTVFLYTVNFHVSFTVVIKIIS